MCVCSSFKEELPSASASGCDTSDASLLSVSEGFSTLSHKYRPGGRGRSFSKSKFHLSLFCCIRASICSSRCNSDFSWLTWPKRHLRTLLGLYRRPPGPVRGHVNAATSPIWIYYQRESREQLHCTKVTI